MKRVFLETYGCQMNVADSELMAGVLQRAGLELVDRAEDADAVILNTCAIRENAEQRVLGRLGDYAHLKLANPALIVGVAGCMAQHLRAKLLDRKRVLDLVVGPDGYRFLPELLRRAAGEPVAEVRLDRDETYGDLEPKRGPGVRAWVTVQRGCDKFCTYCVVPFTRGRERSLPLADLVRQIEHAAAEGFREVVLLGQTVNSWREGTDDFADLLRAVGTVDGVRRIRFTSPYPTDFTPRVIEAMATTAAVCEHVHLPLQSGSNAVLKRMRRRYTRERYLEVVGELRQAIPDITLSTDIIVGLPGETEQQFQETLGMVTEAGFDDAYTFKYSVREGTPAERIVDHVPEEVASERLQRLIEMARLQTRQRNASRVGQVHEVLVERPAKRGHLMLARTRQNFLVLVDVPRDCVGEYRRVRLTGTTGSTFTGALEHPALVVI